jgi:hypothetical protein
MNCAKFIRQSGILLANSKDVGTGVTLQIPRGSFIASLSYFQGPEISVEEAAFQ